MKKKTYIGRGQKNIIISQSKYIITGNIQTIFSGKEMKRYSG